MPYSLAVAGSKVYAIGGDGQVYTIGMPTGITVIPGARARFAILDRVVVIAHATNRAVAITGDAVARPLALSVPPHGPTLASSGSGTLTGDYRAKVAFVVKDEAGDDLAEGPAGPASAAVTLAGAGLLVSNIPTSPDDQVTGRRVYRTASGGNTFFEWFDLDDNTTTTFLDNAPDAALSIVPLDDETGLAAGRMRLITEWKGRLWAVSLGEPDRLAFSVDGRPFVWPATFSFDVPPVGGDSVGITGFLPRRDEMAVGKREILWKIVGSAPDDFRLVKLVEGTGILAPDAALVTRDVGRFLALDGVYEWDSEGVRSITDDDVKPWFTTDDFFNRALFPDAFAHYNPRLHAYELCLPAAGQTTFNRWVTFDIARRKWLGPHATAAFVPTAAGVSFDDRDVKMAVLGAADGYLWRTDPLLFRDGAASAIDFSPTLAFHTGGAPDIEHFWGLLSVLTRIESGGTLDILVRTGGLDAAWSPTILHDLTTGREKLRRGGTGRLMQIAFRNTELNQPCEIYGYELPFHELGRR